MGTATGGSGGAIGCEPWISCTERILIENVPAWDGVPNPISSSNRIYMVGAQGNLATFDAVPFGVDREGLGCSVEAGCGGLKPDTYVLTAAGAKIQMAQTKAITAAGRDFALHNLRSYQTGNCDDYWNWGFWAVES